MREQVVHQPGHSVRATQRPSRLELVEPRPPVALEKLQILWRHESFPQCASVFAPHHLHSGEVDARLRVGEFRPEERCVDLDVPGHQWLPSIHQLA